MPPIGIVVRNFSKLCSQCPGSIPLPRFDAGNCSLAVHRPLYGHCKLAELLLPLILNRSGERSMAAMATTAEAARKPLYVEA